MPPLTLRARWVFPIEGPPLDGGVVTIDGGRIVAVGRSTDAPLCDLGEAALLPGLVNAHTHLEFSDLDEPLGRPGEPLPSWIHRVVDCRRQPGRSPPAAVRRGLYECLAGGATTIGEIATGDTWTQCGAAAVAPEVVVFHESIGLTADRAARSEIEAQARLERGLVADQITVGLSPHAPYTVRPSLLKALVEMAAEHGAPLAMHLAESPEEMELLRAGTGSLVDLLASWGAWDEEALPRPTRPLEYLQALAPAPRALVIHGNFLDRSEEQFLAEHSSRMALVHCPRTHARFGHRATPLADLLARGVRLALGTDSRASNPDLSLWNEWRFLASRQPGLAPSAALRLATLAGAEALGRADQEGSLLPGRRANLLAVSLPSPSAGDPHEQLLDPACTPRAVWWRGIALPILPPGG